MKTFTYQLAVSAILIVLETIGGLAIADETTQSSTSPGEWVQLFDGKSLDGWKASEATDSFYIKDGCIVADGKPRSHLFYMADLQAV